MSAFAESWKSATDACWSYLFHASWQAGLVGLLLLGAVAIGRRWPAPLRYALLLVALVKFLLPPFAATPFGVFSQLSPPLGAAAAPRAPAVIAQGRPTLSAATADGLSQPTELFAASEEPVRPLQTAPPLEAAAPVRGRTRSQSQAQPTARISAKVRSAAVNGPLARVIAPAVEYASPAAFPWDARQSALAAWIAGMCLAIMWLGDQQRRLARMLRGSSSVEEAGLKDRMRTLAARVGLRRAPELRQSAAGSMPFSCGLFAPKVVVPARLIQELSPAQLDVVLAHELAHHRRRDLWVNVWQVFVFVAFWFHPVAWMLNRSIRRVREDCCDDLLLARGVITPESCCETLLAVARGQSRSCSLVWSVSMVHPLGLRLTRLMDDSQSRRSGLSRGGWLLVGLAGALLWPGLHMTSLSAGDDPARDRDTSASRPRAKSNDAKPISQPPAVRTAKESAGDGFPNDFDYAGLVTDADGKPLEGAQISVSYPREPGPKFVPQAKTKADGRFQIRLRMADFLVKGRMSGQIRFAATALGYGPAFVRAYAYERRTNLVFKLPKDDVPIRGQIVTTGGKPVRDVTIALQMLQRVEENNGTPLSLDLVKEGRDQERKFRKLLEFEPDFRGLFPPVTTDAAGRFEIRGVGRERVARLLISSTAIEARWISVATRPIVPQVVPRRDGQPRGLYATYRSWANDFQRPWWFAQLGFGGMMIHDERNGEPVLAADFVQMVRPSCPIVGVVRDARTGSPLAGVRVSSQPPPYGLIWDTDRSARDEPTVADTTNDRGEFRLIGVPKRNNAILAESPESLPYFNRSVGCNTRSEGVETVSLEIRLTRGIAVTGRLVDANGKPTEGQIRYYPLIDNPYIESLADAVSIGRTYERWRPQYPEAFAAKDGRFLIPVMPGPGILLARPNQRGTRRARFDEAEDSQYASYHAVLDESDPTVVPAFPRRLSLDTFDAYKGIDLTAETDSAEVELAVAVGHVVEGQVLDGAGRPLAGITALGTSHDPLPESGKFNARGLVPGKPRLLYFLQEAKQLAGFCSVHDGQRSPVSVQIQACGTVRGRLADVDGNPMAHAHFYLVYAEADGVPRMIFPGGWRIPTAAEVARSRWDGRRAPPAVERPLQSTDQTGSFVVGGLIPRLTFRLLAQTADGKEYPMIDTSVPPGQDVDLGTVKLPIKD